MSYKKNKGGGFKVKGGGTGPMNSFSLDNVYDKMYPNSVASHSFFAGKDIYYGRIDGNNNTVNVDEAHLKEIATNNNSSVQCLNFVADAFSDMRKYIKVDARSKIAQDQFLNNKWDAMRGWSSPHIFYDEKMDELYKIFVNGSLSYRKNEEKISNIDDFIKVFFNDFYPSIARKIPITKSGLIMSKYFNPTSTGLCIETSKEDFTRNFSKISKYIQSPNFEFYALAAAKYGFLIDRNAPFRLVANLNSPAMQKYMSTYNVTIDNLFDKCYFKTYMYDIENLKIYIKQMYSAFTSISPIVIRESTTFENSNCESYGQSSFVASPREKINDQRYDEEYNQLFWLKMYYRIKLKETETNISESLLTRESLKVEQVYNSLDFDSTLDYINDKIKSQIPWV
tara:strand:+ start:90 stop:1277 length:1188 start_codon:yes stop_codon:yes gene_type:complete